MASNHSTLLLAFHRVSDEFSPAYPPIPIKVFDKICRYLKRYFEVIHPNELLNNTPTKKQKVLITFDDAYQDFLTCAYPILKKHQLPVIQHVITHCAETGESFWTQRLNKTIEAYLSEKKAFVIPNLVINEPALSTSSIEQIALTTYKKMLPMDSDEREAIISTLREVLQFKVYDTPMLQWKDLKELQKDPNIVIGSHTHTHKNLSTLNETELYYELNHSKKLIEENLNINYPLFLAYPNGKFNKQVKAIAKEIGYEGAFTTENTCFNLEVNETFEIPRFLIYHRSWWKNWIHINRLRFL